LNLEPVNGYNFYIYYTHILKKKFLSCFIIFHFFRKALEVFDDIKIEERI